MEIYIYFGSKEEVNIGDLEDKIDEILDDKGEVTGSGMGTNGGNLDIEVYDKNIFDNLLIELTKLEFPNDTYLIIDGIKKNLY